MGDEAAHRCAAAGLAFEVLENGRAPARPHREWHRHRAVAHGVCGQQPADFLQALAYADWLADERVLTA